MAYLNSTLPFEKMLMKFVTDEDPMQAMLKWLCERYQGKDTGGRQQIKYNLEIDIFEQMDIKEISHVPTRLVRYCNTLIQARLR